MWINCLLYEMQKKRKCSSQFPVKESTQLQFFTLVFPFLVVYTSTLLHFYLLTLDISYFADYKVLVPK